MNNKCVKIHTPSTPGQLLETKSFSLSVLLAGDIIASAIDENFSPLFSIFRLSPSG